MNGRDQKKTKTIKKGKISYRFDTEKGLEEKQRRKKNNTPAHGDED